LKDQLLHKIAITLLDGIGAINSKKLIAYCGGVHQVFESSRADLEKIPGISAKLANNIVGQKVMERAKKELAYIQEEGIKTLFYLDADYPLKLKNCPDAPILLYYKGNIGFNDRKILSIVGTRNATHYGKEFIAQCMKELVPYHPSIVSGLAHGIDVTAHKEALKNGLDTVGIVAHGLDEIGS